MNHIQQLAALLRVDGSALNVPRDLSDDDAAAMLDSGLILLTGDDDERPDRRYEATDYARDIANGKLPGDGKPRGRPPLPPGQALSERFEVRCTPAQLAKLETLGGQQWLRDRIDRAR